MVVELAGIGKLAAELAVFEEHAPLAAGDGRAAVPVLTDERLHPGGFAPVCAVADNVGADVHALSTFQGTRPTLPPSSIERRAVSVRYRSRCLIDIQCQTPLMARL